MKHVVLSLSGGMDSSTLLLHLLEKKYKITAISFDYGQKHRIELERAQQLVDYLQNYLYTESENLDYQVIKLDGLSNLLVSNLVEGGDDVPEGHYEEDNMKATVVPNRNKIFSSIIQAVALSIANETGEKVEIAMGIHAGDHAIYPDCRQEFRDADYNAFKEGNWDAEKVTYYTPYLSGDKFDILKDGLKCIESLNEINKEDFELDFNEFYSRTNTSYKPTAEGLSDYKSASSVERIEAFLKLGRPDPVEYIDGWETAKEHVEALLEEKKPSLLEEDA